MSDDIDGDEYHWHLLSPPVWVLRGDDLLDAAQLLESETRRVLKNWDWEASDELESLTNGVVGVYFMLIGFALENLLKAKLIRLNRDVASTQFVATRKLPAFLKSHDLRALAADAGFRPTQSDEVVLTLLTRAVVWDGRYPIPARVSDMHRIVKSREGQKRRMSFQELDVDDVLGLVAKIREKLNLRSPRDS